MIYSPMRGVGMAARRAPSNAIRAVVWLVLCLLLAWAAVVAVLMTSAGGGGGGGSRGPWRMPVYLNPFGGRRAAAAAVAPPLASSCDDQGWKRQTLGQERAWPPESTVQCAMWGTWTEACYYENVCFDAHERALLFWKDEKSPDTGISPLGARDWAANAAAAAGAEGAEDPYDRDPSYGYPVYSPLRWHLSHNDLLTGQVLPLSQFPRHGARRPKLFPFNSNMKGRFMTDEEAQIHWRRTAAEWDAQRHGRPPPFAAGGADAATNESGSGTGAGPIEEMPVEEAMRLVYGAEGGDADSAGGSDGGGSSSSWWAAALGGAASAGGLLPAEDTALVLSNKVQLQNIWYYSSRVTPWFEAARLNGSGMLPFLLPQPAVAFLHTSERLVGSDWHRSFLALAMGMPKHVLFPRLYGPPPTPSNSGTPRPSPKRGGKPTRSPAPPPLYPQVVELANGARYWAGQRVPRVLYKLVPPKEVPAGGAGAGGGPALPLEEEGADSGPDIIIDAATSEGAATGDNDAGASGGAGADADPTVAAPAAAALAADAAGGVAAGRALLFAAPVAPPPPRSGANALRRAGAESVSGGRALLYKTKPEPSAGAAVRNSDGGYSGAIAGAWVVTDESDIVAAEAAAARISPRPPSSRRPKPSPEPSPVRAAAGGSPIDPNADEERTRCFRKLVLTGASGFVFGDTYSGSEFRARALASIGRNDQPKFLGPGMPSFFNRHLPPRKVLLIDRRRGKPRHIVNSDAIKELLTAYEVPFTHLVDFRGTFEEQVGYYNDHGILLGVHGAGFINCMFMRQGSAVIEVFPYHVKHTLYQRQAYAAGLTHFSVYATDPTGLFKRGNALFAYLKAGCEGWPSVMTQWKDNACRGPLIGAQLTAPMRSLEEALVNALDMIGSRTEYLGLYNDAPLATVADKPSLEGMLGDFAPSPRPSRGALPTRGKPSVGATPPQAAGAGGGGSATATTRSATRAAGSKAAVVSKAAAAKPPVVSKSPAATTRRGTTAATKAATAAKKGAPKAAATAAVASKAAAASKRASASRRGSAAATRAAASAVPRPSAAAAAAQSAAAAPPPPPAPAEAPPVPPAPEPAAPDAEEPASLIESAAAGASAGGAGGAEAAAAPVAAEVHAPVVPAALAAAADDQAHAEEDAADGAAPAAGADAVPPAKAADAGADVAEPAVAAAPAEVEAGGAEPGAPH